MLYNLYFFPLISLELLVNSCPIENHKVSLAIKKACHIILMTSNFTPVTSTYIKKEKKYNLTCNPIHLDFYNWAFTYSKTYLSHPPHKDQFYCNMYGFFCLYIQELLSFIQSYSRLTPVGCYVGIYINLRRDLQSRTRTV